ncbi:MAG TPA: CpsB/CapC family capsule biosynthesis tyrosine phosphatase, partial [Blastocatellia bacterium]|nr:CpsB/CapC family capsule biosynthesis tyrosine phosphatase [Blastocatellia bacterium]
ERFYELVEMGALGQVDTGSVTGQFGKKVQQAARLMLEHGLIHFIASDCHNTRNRLPGMSEGVRATAEIVGREYAQALADDNPSAVVEGRPIPVRPQAVLPQKKRRWLFFG